MLALIIDQNIVETLIRPYIEGVEKLFFFKKKSGSWQI